MPKVALVSMPFGLPDVPSMGLSLLKPTISDMAETKVFYFSLSFAKHIGYQIYKDISEGEPSRFDLLGEWLFAENLYPEGTGSGNPQDYVEDVLLCGTKAHRHKRPGFEATEAWLKKIHHIRAQTAPFLDRCLAELAAFNPDIIAFTSMFQEHTACLSLARKIKEHMPHVYVVIGGCNCEGVMGLETRRQFPQLDAVVSGEADAVFPELIRRKLAGESLVGLEGVHHDPPWEPGHCQPIETMDDLPFPDYSDFFEQWAALEMDQCAPPPKLVYETARGCWWGEVKHCTFCGFNGVTMKFRSKSAEKVREELLRINALYPGFFVGITDSILNYRFIKELMPSLKEEDLSLQLYYEVKSNLKKPQVQALREAGVVRIQPGIESFSTPILNLMGKGVRGLQNIQLLKWCREFDIQPIWGILYGFPKEDPREYDAMADLIPLISHLYPPGAVSQIRIDRFSPNFDFAEEKGLVNLRPYPSHCHTFPTLSEEARANLAYHFDYEHADGRNPTSYVGKLLEAVAQWREQAKSSALFYVPKKDLLMIWDFRSIAPQVLTILQGPLAALYQICDSGMTRARIGDALKQDWPNFSDEEIDRALMRLVDQKLFYTEGGLYLSLAIGVGAYQPSSRVADRLVSSLAHFKDQETKKATIPITDYVLHL